jgi:hypothetical protein
MFRLLVFELDSVTDRRTCIKDRIAYRHTQNSPLPSLRFLLTYLSTQFLLTVSSSIRDYNSGKTLYSYSVSTKPFGFLKNCGAQTNWASHMRFAADYSETLEVFFCRQQDGISGHLYVSQSVVCEMATVQERARCVGWQRLSNALASMFTRHNTTGFFSCGVISRAMCAEHQLTDLMTWRPVSGMRSRLFQRTCSTEHGKSSIIVWTFSVLPREPTSRSTEVSKKLPEFHCNLPQTACG